MALENVESALLSIAAALTPDQNEGWIPVTFENSWTNYAGGYAAVAYRKDKNGVVHLKGLIKNGSSASADMFSLPEGYRPSEQHVFSSYASTGVCRIDVDVDGDVWAQAGGSTTWTTLSGITFLAEQ